MSKLNYKFNLNSIMKITFTLICLGGLIYQTFQLFSEYMSGKTVVRIEVGRVFNDTLPAITICYPFFLSFKKLSKMDLEYNKEYENYLDVLKTNRSSPELKEIYDNVII